MWKDNCIQAVEQTLSAQGNSQQSEQVLEAALVRTINLKTSFVTNSTVMYTFSLDRRR